MEEAVAGGIVGAAAQAVIEKLLSLISLKFNQVEDFIADMEKLKSNFEWIQATLDNAGMQHITSRVVKLWLRKLEDVSDEAFHALDEFHYHLLRQMRNKMEMEAQTSISLMKKAKSIFSGSYSNDPRQILGRKVKDINERLDSLINQESKYLGIHQMILGSVNNTPAMAFASPETDSFTVDPVFIEREKDVSAIVEMLANIPTEGDLSILPIVGMCGLGKTTLARKVFHHERVSARFPTRIWVHVSTTFDANTLFKKMLEVLAPDEVNVENRQAVLTKLQNALACKTFLLVLDDVWNQDPRIWEENFLYPLSGICSTKGNAIIVTTRNRQVCSIVETLPTYELQGLSEEGCCSIIKARAFGKTEIREIPLEEFHDVGKNIAKRCQGLPLAASVVGGLLRGKSKDDWVSIEQNWLSNFDEDEDNISKILKLSFHHLPSPSLKKCFVYCSIFHKGDEIWREDFIELWMAEGFLGSSDMENVGNKYLNLLLQNSLLQVVDRDCHGNVTRCSMHDLVHDLAISVSNDIYNARYIRWQCNGDASSCIPEGKAKRCHALSYGGAISDINFSDFKSLHSLTLSGDDIKELPDSIRELIHLRYLDISQTSIEHLPESIVELHHLQILRMWGFYFRPSRMGKGQKTLNLVKSTKLRIRDSTDYRKLPHVGKLTFLRRLPRFKVYTEDGLKIVELKNLTSLQGELKIDNLEKVQGVEESEKANLFQKSGIINLVLNWDRGEEVSIEGERNDEDVLKGLQPHPNLKKLRIAGFKGKSFPLWTLRMAVRIEHNWVGLNNLMNISLVDCEECEEIPTLGHLPRLKSLSLSGLRNVKSIGVSFYGIDRCSSNTGICNETVIVFPALESLTVWDMPNLREWAEVEIPSEARDIKVFPRLKDLSIVSCKQLANIPAIKSTSLNILKIYVLDELVCLPDGIFQNNQNPSVLKICRCPKLRETPDGLLTLTSLTELKIADFGVEELPEWIGNLSSLRKLCLWYCEQLRSLPSMEAMRRLTNLEILEIEGCPLLEERCKSGDDDSEWPKISHIPNISGIRRNAVI